MKNLSFPSFRSRILQSSPIQLKSGRVYICVTSLMINSAYYPKELRPSVTWCSHFYDSALHNQAANLQIEAPLLLFIPSTLRLFSSSTIMRNSLHDNVSQEVLNFTYFLCKYCSKVQRCTLILESRRVQQFSVFPVSINSWRA